MKNKIYNFFIFSDEEVEEREKDEEYTYENGIIYGIGIGVLITCTIQTLMYVIKSIL